jgi:hypothetical protein
MNMQTDNKSQSREKYWQKVAGELAQIANWMYHYVDESKLNSNDLDDCHDKVEFIKKYLVFDDE